MSGHPRPSCGYSHFQHRHHPYSRQIVLLGRHSQGIKPGKRWVLYSDELDKYLEVNRRNSVPVTAEEQNEVILDSHRRKPVKSDWRKEHDCQTPKTEQV